jgi:hypothetical protein
VDRKFALRNSSQRSTVVSEHCRNNCKLGNYATGSKNATFTAATATPTVSFTVANQTFGVAPISVTATSASSGTFTYAVVSGPVSFSGNTVTINGAGPVVL